MSLQRLRNTAFWKRIMSALDTSQPPSPVSLSPPIIPPQPHPREVTPPEQHPQEPPRKRRRQAKNKQGFEKPENRNADLFTKADWTIDGPYRRVPPYFYTYWTWAKERWLKRTLLETFCSEFRDRQPEYYKSAIAKGTVTVNGKVVDENYVIQNGDCISHTIHRHEPPVSSRPVRVIHHNPATGLLVIDKPAGIPVHPSGRYHQNSVVTIVRLELGFMDAGPCNRLDRLTSGVMFFHLNSKIASEMHAQLFERSVWKEYYCRVVGRFPEEEVKVDKPILTISPKHGLNRLREDGKPSCTVFERIFYDEKRDQSVVLAKPLTGRTHQIRVHLQYLGHPIANDPIYANPYIFPPTTDLNAVTDDELIARLDGLGKSVAATTLADPTPNPIPEENITSVRGLDNPEMREMWSGEICDVCGTQLYLDPAPGELEIWLHAWKYSGKNSAAEGEEATEWSYQSEVPEWGKEDWVGAPIVVKARRRSSSITRIVLADEPSSPKYE